ncbi:SIR2 family protein [Streptomyces sp. NPDC013157]|uniref:P-loop NTPase n=1 Tax=Streptomyces sp. NPDC013157 TaxID=3364861 RepID=UPI0036922AE8
MSTPWMSVEQWDSMMRAITESKYQLLLGAGASLDSEGPLGPLPGGWDLAQEMGKAFSLPGNPRGNLRQVFSMARSRVTADGQNVLAYMADRFANCTAPSWYADLVSIPWRYIWSLNIDDSVENAYNKQFTDHTAKELVPVSWTDPHRVPSGHQVILVHLHGVAWAKKMDDLVFDISSYLYAVTQRHRWHSIFADSYLETPTIILGASLNDEIDLENVLEKGRVQGSSEPSVIVMPTIDEFDKERFRAWGLIPVEATAEEFLAKVRASWPKYFQQADVSADNPSRINPNLLSFLSQWHPIRAGDEYRLDDRHDFYAGHEPLYSDILRDLDSHRVLTDSVFREAMSDEQQKVICLTGSAFTGKSTIALRVARKLVEQDWTPYLLDPELRPSQEATLWWLRQHPRTLLIVEGAADFASDLADMALHAKERGIPFKLLAVERRSRAREVRRSFTGGVRRRGGLRQAEGHGDRGSDPTAQRARTARHRGRRRPHRTGRVLHAAAPQEPLLGDVEPGGGRRVPHQGTDGLLAPEERDRASGVPGRVHHIRPRIRAADRRCGVRLRTVGERAERPAALRVGARRFHPRRRGTPPPAAPGIWLVHAGELLQRAGELQRHPETRPALWRADLPGGHLVAHVRLPYGAPTPRPRDADRVAGRGTPGRLVRGTAGDVRLENARYWEQRALGASKRGRHAPASSWARQAIAQHRDAFALNTLATVLFRRYLAEGGPEHNRTENLLEVAAYLEEARAMAAEDSEYPYITFFKYTLKWVDRAKKANGSIDRRIVRRWNDWTYLVNNSPITRSPEVRDQLQSFRRRWLMLA